jgi:hypothetical protein
LAAVVNDSAPRRSIVGRVHELGSEDLDGARAWWNGVAFELRPGNRVNVFASVVDGVYAEWIISEADDRAALQDAASAVGRLGHARLESLPEVHRKVSFTASLMSEMPAGRDVLASAPYMMAVAFAAPPEHVDELDEWYTDEHTEYLLRCPTWTQVRVHEVDTITGAAWSRLALHALADPNVVDDPAVKASRATHARQRLAEHPWFLSEGRPVLRALTELG